MTSTWRTRAVLGVLGSGGLALGIAGPGAGAAPNARTLVKQAITATEATRTINFAGSVKESGESIGLNVSADEVSGQGQGRLTINGGTAQMVLVGGVVYLDGDANFWKEESGASAASQLAGKWVSTPATSTDGQELSVFVNGKDFLSHLFSANLSDSTFSVTGAATVGSEQATVISGHDKKDKSGGKFYVAKRGKPYVLRLVISSSAGSGTITFSRFNKVVRPKAPSGAIPLQSGTSSTSG
jgi:hypothetical protein